MKAIAASHGSITVLPDLAVPAPAKGHVLIRTEYSAISPGTELTALRRSTDTTIELGYSAVGIVEQVGPEVESLVPGQRVACYGAPYVRHAELMSVPVNLTAAVPDHVDPQEAAFAGLGAIAIHALRVADLRFGERAVVVGLGILGNLLAQIAAAASFVSLGYDRNPERVARLQQCGVPHAYSDQVALERSLHELSEGFGADSVLLCASGDGEKLINDSFTWIRDRGKIVIVGDITANFSRSAMFHKEAQVLISRAGGPGRYDPIYERQNQDYPYGHVRWTEGRNTREYIRLLAEGRIRVKPLITGVYPMADAKDAYDQHIQSPGTTIGTLLKF